MKHSKPLYDGSRLRPSSVSRPIVDSTFASAMRGRKTIFRILLGALLIYFFSYIGISLRGHYEPFAYGPIQGSDDVYIMAPKSVFGYRWNPFGTDIMDPDANHDRVLKMSIIYAPLIFLDHKIWHTKKEMSQVGSGDYRVKNFFDWNTMTYRDIEPD